MLLHLDYTADTPIYLQIRNQIVCGIASGALSPGEQLPPIRTLAEDCGVNMMTVSKAYSLLKQQGYLHTDRRAGTVVCPGKTGVLPEPVREALLLAAAEAKANGADLETVLTLCRSVYEKEDA